MKNYKAFLLLWTMIACMSLSVYSQNNGESLFDEISSDLLTQTQKRMYDKLRAKPKYVESRLVRIGSIAALQYRGAIPIRIPGRQGVLVAQVQQIEAIDEQNFRWIGKFNQVAGDLILIANDDEVFGHISVDDERYNLTSIGKRQSVLSRIDRSAFSETKCTLTGVQGERQSPIYNGSRTAGTSYIRILFLFTPEAQNALGGVNGVNQTASTAVAQINAAFNNSSVQHTTALLVGVEA